MPVEQQTSTNTSPPTLAAGTAGKESCGGASHLLGKSTCCFSRGIASSRAYHVRPHALPGHLDWGHRLFVPQCPLTQFRTVALVPAKKAIYVRCRVVYTCPPDNSHTEWLVGCKFWKKVIVTAVLAPDGGITGSAGP